MCTYRKTTGAMGPQLFLENRGSVLSVLTGWRGHRRGPTGHTGPAWRPICPKGQLTAAPSQNYEPTQPTLTRANTHLLPE